MSTRYRLQDNQAMIAFARFNFQVDLQIPTPRYNIAPNQVVPIIANDEFGAPIGTSMLWNLVNAAEGPSRSPYPRTSAPFEQVFSKPTFLHAIQRRRCLVPADGFYEWELLQGGTYKIPHVFELASSRPFVFAGLYEHAAPSEDPNGPRGRATFSIVTTRSNSLVGRVSDRMPVILFDDAALRWLEPGTLNDESISPFTEPYPEHLMRSRAVSRLLNNINVDSARAAGPYTGDPPSLIDPPGKVR
jgi:putative SOS response-associated peptidase YedK